MHYRLYNVIKKKDTKVCLRKDVEGFRRKDMQELSHHRRLSLTGRHCSPAPGCAAAASPPLGEKKLRGSLKMFSLKPPVESISCNVQFFV